MLNAVRGSLAGALVLVGIIACFLVPLFMVMGPERALVGPSLEFNTIWTGLAMVVCLVAATIAGWIAHRVSGGLAAVALLALLVILFGLSDAGLHHWLMPELSLSREGLTGIGVLVGLREPLWYDLTGPFVMAIFIWVAGTSRHIETASNTSPAGRAQGGFVS